jgi:Cu(I)/Ag(I) efflux system membrane protein CusA/SilA
MGIIVSENILKHMGAAARDENHLEVVYRAVKEVGGAVFTAISTTVVSFLPVFTMQAAEGKLFKPLAFTKTFALIASVIVALFIIPTFAQLLFAGTTKREWIKRISNGALIVLGLCVAFLIAWWAGLVIALVGAYQSFESAIPERWRRYAPRASMAIAVLVVLILLSEHWVPLGPEKGILPNAMFAGFIIGGILALLLLFQRYYGPLLRWCLNHKATFLTLPLLLIVVGLLVWQGFDNVLGWLPRPLRLFGPVSAVAHAFPGLGKEFMPPLDEGSYLLMPTTMPHASIGEALDVLQKQDRSIRSIPEIETVVGKLGRAESPLDPAPISMIETIINYKPEFVVDRGGRRLKFRFDADGDDLFRTEQGEAVLAPDGEPYYVKGTFERDEHGQLIPDSGGKPFRNWRPPLDPELNLGRSRWRGIQSPDDIWDEIVRAAQIPGTTSAPKLQPIATRIVMLQSGMRAPMGVKIKGPDLETIEKVGLQIERFLKEVPSITPATVFADRIVGKPYLEIAIDRNAIARYGLHLARVQQAIEVAIGGKRITTTVEGRERYPVRVRYLRELRDQIETLGRILVAAPDGAQIPLEQLAEIRYVRGPQVIKSEDTFLVGYVTFDKQPGYAEVDVVEAARAYLEEKRESGQFAVPAGVSFSFAGTYENQLRAQSTLKVVLPLALFIIFMILYFQFHTISTTMLVFSGIVVAWSGGFLMIWLYSQPWFLDFSLFGEDMRELFQVHTINLSVAIWVGFLALFGIASDNGVVVATYLKQTFDARKPETVREIREATVDAALRRIRPALMTTATTILALVPVLTSTGRGADIMVPMAIPSFGGMTVAVISLFVVPVLYAALQERRVPKLVERSTDHGTADLRRSRTGDVRLS